jgi:hypothetical protein
VAERTGRWPGEDGDWAARWPGDDSGLQAGVRADDGSGALQAATSGRRAAVRVLQTDEPGGGGLEAAA